MPYITRPNSWVSQDAAATTQLTYALQLNPAPLTVSISGRDPILGSLEFVITNPTASAIALSSVAFTIQVGSAGSNLTTTTANIGASISDSTNWIIQTPGTITSGPAIYTLSPQTGPSVSVAPGASIVVEIYNFPTVENPGNTTINVKETTGSINFTSFLVTTFPSGFYFHGLTATVEKGSQLVPVAQVATGSTTTLVWNSSVVDLASFTIYYSNAAQGQQSATPSDTGLWTSGPLSADTVFTIVVTVSISGGSPLSAALSTTVSVLNPSLIAASIVAGTATVSGALTVSGATQANAINATGVTVTGDISASGTLTAANETLSGALTANSATLASSLRINGSSATPALSIGGVGVFNVDAPNTSGGRFTIQNSGAVGINQPNPGATLDINGNLNVSSGASIGGALSVRSGPVSLLGTGKLIAQGNSIANTGVYAQTDGFAVVAALTPGNNGKSSFAYGYCYTVGNWFQVLGGTVGSFGSGWSSVMNNNPNAICIPIKAGTNWQYFAANAGGNQMDSPTQIWWFPMGGTLSAEESFRILKEGEGELVEPPPPPSNPNDSLEQRKTIAITFIDKLEQALHTSLAAQEKEELVGLLQSL